MRYLAEYYTLWIVIALTLLGLASVLIGWIIFIAAYRKREKLAWSNGMRVVVGIGGTVFSTLVLMAPAAVSWINCRLSTSYIDEAFLSAAPEQKAALVARGFEGANVTSIYASGAQLLLLIPCAVMIGLALTVPFFLTKTPGGES